MNETFRLAPQEWARLRALLDEALALPPAQRDAWLLALDDTRAAGLKPRLAALLAHAGGPAGLMLTLPKVETLDFASPPGADAALAADQRVGPYRLLRELGAGGMASVWLAERTDLLQGRQVALKLPHGAWRRAGLAERLAREREILATLEHPHIARIYDAGVAEDGQPWLALEHVAGTRIDAFCREQGLPVRARLQLFVQVARAVAYAHAQLVVHRDLKPANILVTADGQVKLLDFGVAKLLAEGAAVAGAEDTALTREAGRAYTPEYASPEQILHRPIGTGSDVYSLGVLLFELLADARPYRLPRDSRAALEEAVTRGDLPRPSLLAPPERRRAIRGDLDAIVGRALRREPAERYATVAALADDVERHLRHHPVLARPDSAWVRLRAALRRHRVGVAAGAAVVVALLAGTALATWQARVARQEQQRAAAVKDFIAGIFREAAPHGGSGHASLSALELLRLAEQRMRTAALADPAVRVELSAVLAEALTSFGDLQAAESLLARAASAGLPARHPQALRLAVLQAQAHRLRGREDAARQQLDAVLPGLRERAAQEPRELVSALVHRALAAFAQIAYAEAERYAIEGDELARERLAVDDELRIDGAVVLALSRMFLQKHEAARDGAAAALAAAVKRHGEQPPNPRVAQARTVYGRALAGTGAIAEGVAQIDRAVADMRLLFGADNPQLGITLQNLVTLRVDIGELDEAERNAGEALRILSKVLQPESLTYVGTLATLATARLARRDAAAALPDLERVATAFERQFSARADATLAVRALKAQALARLGRSADARAEVDALHEHAKTAPIGPATRARIALAAGVVARLAGDHAAARRWLQPVAEAPAETPSLQRERMRARAELGLALHGAGAGAEARSWLEQAAADAARLEVKSTPMQQEIARALVAPSR